MTIEAVPPKRRRGRPPKVHAELQAPFIKPEDPAVEDEATLAEPYGPPAVSPVANPFGEVTPPKRKRGRPPKIRPTEPAPIPIPIPMVLTQTPMPAVQRPKEFVVSEQKIFTNEDTLQLLTAKAGETGEDSFWVRVGRKKFPFTDIIARFENATRDHLSRPESWLPQLAGGGSYMLAVGHNSDPSAPVGGPLQYTFKGEGKEPDPRIVDSPEWMGPKKLIFPLPIDPMKAGERFDGGTAMPRPVVGGTTTLPAAAATPSSADFQVQLFRMQMEQMAKDAERRDREFREGIERQRREHQELIARLEQKLAARAPERPALDVPALLAAGTPLVTALFAASEKAKADQEARMQMVMQQQQELTKSLLQRPAMDPATEKVLDRLQQLAEKSQPAGSLEMLDSMSSAMQTMTQIAMKAATAVAEAQMGGGAKEESAGLKAFREGMRALENVFKAVAVQRMGVAQPQQPQRPAFKAITGGANGNAAQPPPPPASTVDQIIEALRSRHAAPEVADVIVGQIRKGDSDLLEAFNKYGSLNDLVADKFGDKALEDGEFASYLRQVLKEVETKGADLFNASEPDERLNGEASGEEAEAAGDVA